MKFEYIILLILAFNVVTALIRKRKARAESAAPKPRDEQPRAEAREGAAPKRGMGRDLLEELAKELGLETGEPERPRPEVPAYRPEAVPENVAARPAARADARPDARSVERTPRKAKPAAPEPAAPMRRAPALDLSDAESLRRAFIAKEVLGPPVSRLRGGR